MKVFSLDFDTREMEIWGPTVSVNVKIEALDDVVGKSWMLSGVRVGAREIVDVRQCFNERSFIYAMGNDQSSSVMILEFVLLVGSKCQAQSSDMSAIPKGLDAYVKNRISVKPQASVITIGDFSGMGWLCGVEMGQIDTRKGLCSGSARFLIKLNKPEGQEG